MSNNSHARGNDTRRADKVLIIYSGGTIGMIAGDHGLEPSRGFEAQLCAALEHLAAERLDTLPAFDMTETHAPIDSSAANPADWQMLAGMVAAYHADYAGIVILHGTDTLAWTASSLSYQLSGIDLPIILTGAMTPLAHQGSDALENVEAALRFAACRQLREVAICFAGKLMRGSRTRKCHTTAHDAFDSPNFSVIGDIVDYQPRLTSAACQMTRQRSPDFELANYRGMHPSSVIRVVLWPGFDAALLRQWLTNDHVRGVLLEIWGGGNMPDDPQLTDVLANASQAGVLIAAISQCPQGEISMGTYAASQGLTTADVLSGGDMTPEAAMTKLFHLLAQPIGDKERRRLFLTSLVGER
ncbi:asparaginase [Aidingimonas lacisalsi]|uniref:asparaginase n=1 Tax=Aidingimonas lacisalsi TaxID=2604086 RepID=UPI0011D20A22|nr:asparaginase [Aidingimonas lacisalsi]